MRFTSFRLAGRQYEGPGGLKASKSCTVIGISPSFAIAQALAAKPNPLPNPPSPLPLRRTRKRAFVLFRFRHSWPFLTGWPSHYTIKCGGVPYFAMTMVSSRGRRRSSSVSMEGSATGSSNGCALWAVTGSSVLWNLTLTILLTPCSCIVTP